MTEGKKNQSRRRSLMDVTDPGEPPMGAPLELPLGTHRQNSIGDEIQRQIAIHTAKKNPG